jgi:EmrB/QacA subfamily drug resistance transporter
MASPISGPRSGSGFRLALLAFTQFIVAIDFNIVYVALPDIGRQLGFSDQNLQWVVSAYSVALGGVLLLGGRAVDRLGPKRMFMIGLSLYALSSLVGGLAGHQGILIGARAIQGIGGALLTPATLTLIFTGFPDATQRNRAMGVWGAAGSAGLAAGSLLGGVLTNYLGWEWVFFVNVPLAAIAVVASATILPTDPRKDGTKRKFDLPGAIVATVAFTMIVFGLVDGPAQGWGSIGSVGAIGLGVVLLAAFILIESRASDPLVPLKLFTNRNLVVTTAAVVLFQATLGGGYYLFTTFLQSSLNYAPLEAGLAFLPLTLLAMLASMTATPRLIARFGIRLTMVGSVLVTAVGIGALAAAMTVGSSFWLLLPGIVIWGLGGGVAFPVLFASVGASGIQPQQQGVASALVSTARQVGGAMGLAAIVAVANSTVIGHGVPSATAVADGLRTGGWVAAVVTVIGALVALGLRRPPAPASAPPVGKAADPQPDPQPALDDETTQATGNR